MWTGLESQCLATRLGIMRVRLKSMDPGWQNARGDGKHLDCLKAMEQHTNANRGMMAQSRHAGKASPPDGEC